METSLSLGARLAGRYRIVANVGEGGFGTVYKARDEQQKGKLVAVKVINLVALSAQDKIDASKAFHRELSLLSSLKQANLLKIYDHFIYPDRLYIVMDYVDGVTLEDLLPRLPDGRLPVERVLKIGLELCDVLGYLHSQHPPIIFRDLKPGNIMLTPWGKLYLIDFGIARHYQIGKMRDTDRMGSPGFAAPEQYGSMQSMERTDIYGLGATLQTLLTGRDPLEIKQQGWPSDVVVPPALMSLLLFMLSTEPVNRPMGVGQVRDWLLAVQRDEGKPFRFPRNFANVKNLFVRLPGNIFWLGNITKSFVFRIVGALLFVAVIWQGIWWLVPDIASGTFFQGFGGLMAWVLLLMLAFVMSRLRGFLALFQMRRSSISQLSAWIIPLSLLSSKEKQQRIGCWVWLPVLAFNIIYGIVGHSVPYISSISIMKISSAIASPLVLPLLILLLDEAICFTQWSITLQASRKRSKARQKQPQTPPLQQQMRRYP